LQHLVKSEREPFNNRSLDRALQILCSFRFDKQELSLTELSQILDLSRSTVYRLASTLVRRGFLKYDQTSKRYTLGLKLFELGSIVFSSFSLRRVASPHLTWLQSEHLKTVFLAVLQDDELVYVDKREGIGNAIRFSEALIGMRRPPYFGSFGQLLMAYMPDGEADRLLRLIPLKPLTRNSITRVEEFKKRLEKIRSQGYAVEAGEVLENVTGVAAPVRDHTGKVIAAVGVGFISSFEDSVGIRKIIKHVVKVAGEISQEIGCREADKPPHRLDSRKT
jgi:IclR family transcriptional regulator, KDG regulon repressor